MGLDEEADQNLAIVRSTYEGATSEENGQNLAAYAADDIVWIEAAGFPYAGRYVGLEAIVANVFARLGSEWTDYRFEPERFVAAEGTVVAIGTYSGTNNATSRTMTARVAHIWLLESGRIVAFEQIVDSQPVVDATVQ